MAQSRTNNLNRKSPTQLPFSLPVEPQFRREDLIEGSTNRTAIGMIDAWPDWPGHYLLLSGPSGSGKTHLASVWAEKSSAKYVQCAVLPNHADEIINDAAAGNCLVVEDLSPETLDQNTLFHVLNAIRQAGAHCLLTSATLPSGWDLSLKDLESRFRSVQTVELGPPDDALLKMVMAKLFADRQLAVNPKVIETCLLRMERSLDFANLLVDRIDREALAAGSAVSRQLVGKVFDQLAEESGENADQSD